MILKTLFRSFLVLLLVVAGFSNQEAKASHVAGVDVSYQCVGQDSFLVTVNVFRDCSGIGWSATSITLNITNSCGHPNPTLTTIQTTNVVIGGQAQGINVSQLCPNSLNQSACNGGTLPGMELYTYQGIIVLSPPCNSWTIGYQPPCCRNNNNINNITNASSGTFVFATMNSQNDSCNNSPAFSTNFPNPYACVNQQVCYDYGVTEQDGDSLVYSLVSAYTALNQQATYNAGFSGTVPIPGITIDSLTGKVQFTPTTAGNYVVVVEVCEYERGTGLLLGCIMRDMQFVVDQCANQAPSLCTADTISNFQGSGAKISNNTVEVCYGQNFSFDVTITDPDPNDSLTATSNIATILPGATMTLNHAPGGNPLTVTFSWTATIGSNPFNSFNLQVSDQNCPITATNTAVFNVKVVPSTYAGPDKQICRGVETATFSAIGGSTFTWAVLAGDPNSLSCSSCKSVTVNPDSTTTYEVTSDLSSSCKNKDTVTVIVAQNYTLNMSSDTLICFNDSAIQIGAFPSIVRPFSYQWSPSAKMNYDTVQTPTVTPITNTTFNVTTTSDSGCVKTNSVTVRVTNPFPREIEATTLSGDTVSCQGVPITLDAKLATAPASCGISANPCSGVSLNKTLGTGTATNSTSGNASSTAWPAPYGGSERSAKHQFIIRRSELAAAGITAGTITELGFNVLSNNGPTTYDNYTIKLGCISDSTFALINGTYWKTGLVTVFTPKSINVSPGWNMHNFDNKYDYDGQSHLVVEVCFDNASGNPTQNAQTYYSTTSFGSSLFFYSGSVNACPSLNLLAPPVNRRPNMRFTFCGPPDSRAFRYQWWPNTGISSDTVKNPQATLQDSITYSVAVQDTTGSCFDTSSVKLFLTTIEVSNDTAVCPNIPFQLFANGQSSCTGGAGYQWSPANLLDNDTISTPTASITQTTMFYVTYQDQCGCTITDSILVTKKEIDSLNVIENVPTCGQANGSLLFQARGGTAPYQFSIDSGYTLQNDSVFNNLNNGYFEFFVVDAEGCIVNRKDTFTNTAPIIDSVHAYHLSCFESQNGEIHVFTSEGMQPLQFSVDGGATFQANDTLTGLTAGGKTIIVRAADGCETAPIDTILTQPDPLVFDLKENVVSCYNGNDGKLTITPTGGTWPYSYSWSTPNGTDSVASNISSGTYSVTVTDAQNCQKDSTYFVDQPDSMVIDSIDFVPITCHGYDNGVFSFFVSGGNGNYSYSIDSGATYFFNNEFDSIAPGTYNIVLKDFKNCISRTTETVTEPAPLIITPLFDSTTICVSNCIEVGAPYTGGNPGQVEYFWSPSLTDTSSFDFCPEEDSKFIVYAKDEKNCASNIAEIEIFLFDSLTVTTSPDTHICAEFGKPILAYPEGGDGNGFNYEWTPYPGLSSPKVRNPIATPSQSTMYVIELTDNCGSPAVYDSVFVEVFPNPEAKFSSNETEGCQQQLITFSNNTLIGNNCLWDFGDGNTAQSCNLIAHPYLNPGFYDVKLRVQAQGGCMDSLIRKRYIKIYPNPLADFIMNPQPATILDPEVQFTDISQGDIATWNWNFGSFAASEESNPLIEFPVTDSGVYPIKLAVTTVNGCYDDTIKNAVVDVNLQIYAPTGFTPNGDGLNDEFYPKGIGINEGEFEFIIFDRWGKEVFRTNKPNDGWDGNLKSGEPAPGGIYVWKLVVGNYASEKEREEVIGNITLMR